ncbi:hypothetical protein [Novosphingobium sp.]|uniref:hypothetical protein n=1 Tax=Novosphingobium sp. TaxID=1874826 RepID=UPI0038B6BEE3
MAFALEPGWPQTLGEAFAHIGKVTAPGVDDFKIMSLVEAASETLYRVTAQGTDHAGVIDLLHHNGREEMVHARRAAQVVTLLGGGDFAPPSAEENPYLAAGALPFSEVTPEALRKLAQGEFGGQALYEGWAASLDHPEAAALLRQNGAEEVDHGNRLMQAAALLES